MKQTALDIHRYASQLQKKGEFTHARTLFLEILNSSDSRQLHSAAYYHLAQMENDFSQRKKLLAQCLAINPDFKMARVLFNCLTSDLEQRLAKNSGKLIAPFFDRAPLNIQIQTVSGCNGGCIMCPYHHSWQKKNPGRMDSALYSHILALLGNIPLGKYCLYLENEPLLDKTLIEKIREAKQRLNFKTLEIATNLSLFTREAIEKLYLALKDTDHEIWISWHGITPASYHQLMGLDFNENLKKLVEYFKITDFRLKTVIRSIIGSKADSSQKFSTKEQTEQFFRDILRANQLPDNHPNFKIHTFCYHNRAGNVKTDQNDEWAADYFLKPDCWRIKQWLHILWDGTIILCCMDYHKETDMGNIRDFQSLEALFLSKKFRQIQQQALGEIESAPDFICRRCTSIGG